MKRPSIEREVDDSLRRLDVDVLDLCQVHWPTPDEDIEEALETLEKIRSRGKIRYVGVSNFSVAQLERVRPLAEIVSLQPPYSLAFTEVEKEILPYCAEHGIGAINYSPMASGLLSGKMTRERIENMPDDDWRKKHRRFRDPELSKYLQLAELLAELERMPDLKAGKIEDRAEAQLAGRAIKRLRPKEREAVLLSVYQGMSHSEISTYMEIPLGTVKTYIRRG